jgi:DNA repair exonuclease SbcCD ATPase subunit
MPQKLTDMIIDEISLVDDGANQHADVVIVKRNAPAEGDTGSEGNSGDFETASADDKEFQMDMENLAKALEDAEAKLETLEKRTTDAEAALADATSVIKAKDAEIEELQKGYKAKAEKSADGDADDEDEDKQVMKSLPESIRKRIEDFEKRAAEAETTLAKMREEKDTAEAIAKAKSLNFGKAEEVGPLLMRVAKGRTTQADADTLERLFKAAGEQGKVTHLFRSVGSDTAVDGDPEVLMKAKADEIQKANKGMTFEQAYVQAVETNPSLYNAYIAKRRVG